MPRTTRRPGRRRWGACCDCGDVLERDDYTEAVRGQPADWRLHRCRHCARDAARASDARDAAPGGA